MKRKIMTTVFIGMLLVLCAPRVWAGEMDVLVNKLVEKGILTPYEGQILMAQAKEEAAKELAEAKAITAPEWTQRIKVKGDVRFRTQADWGKSNAPAHARWRQRVRARLGVEGKVNEQIYAGLRGVTGSDDPRSTNQTLGVDGFEHGDFRLDKYYIRWQPELPQGIGDAKIWAGKLEVLTQASEVLWDGDITPGGMGIQYMSPTFSTEYLPDTNLYANGGGFWIDEFSTSERDPIVWMLQGGLILDIVKDWDAKVDMGIAYYDFANTGRNPNWLITTPNGGSQTNSTWGSTNQYEYDYNIIDILVRYDSKSLFDLNVGHGVYGDFLFNTTGGNEDFACQVGGYLGDKKLKKPGQWKLWGEWRYIEQNAVPDFTPDSDFYGFNRLTGVPRAGGTNGQGFNGGIEYCIFKNTVLSAEYYWCTPIKLDGSAYKEPYNLLQLDIKTKF